MSVVRAAPALAAVLAAAALAAPAPAEADRPDAVSLADEAGDVWTYSDVTLGYEPAVRPEADVLRARVVHGRFALRVRLVFDDLRREDTQWYTCEVRTAAHTTQRFVIEAKRGHWRGLLWQEVDGEPVPVPGAGHHIDYTSDVVDLRLPRRILAGPAWVRVSLRNDLGLPDHSTFFTDNPANATPHPGFGRRLWPAAAG